MNVKDELTEATILALQGKLTEASENLDKKQILRYFKGLGFELYKSYEKSYADWKMGDYKYKDYILSLTRHTDTINSYMYYVQIEKKGNDFDDSVFSDAFYGYKGSLIEENVFDSMIGTKEDINYYNKIFQAAIRYHFILADGSSEVNYNYNSEYLAFYIRRDFYRRYINKIFNDFEYKTDNYTIEIKLTKDSIKLLKPGMDKIDMYLEEYKQIYIPKIKEYLENLENNEIKKVRDEKEKREASATHKYRITYYKNSDIRDMEETSPWVFMNTYWYDEKEIFDTDIEAFEYICKEILNWDINEYMGDTDAETFNNLIKTFNNLIKAFKNGDLDFGKQIIISIENDKYKYDSGIDKKELVFLLNVLKKRSENDEY